MAPRQHTETRSTVQDGHGGDAATLVRETVPIEPDGLHGDQSSLIRETPAGRPPKTRVGSVVRISFGLIWLTDAWLKWLPAFQHGLPDVLHDGGTNQPAWLMPWFHFNQAVVAINPTAWALGIALVETVIGLFLIFGLARKLTYIFGALWSVGIWATAEGFGHPNPGMPWTDIGTAIMYTFIFLVLLALDAQAGKVETGTRRDSLDSAIERRRPGWRTIAEMRR